MLWRRLATVHGLSVDEYRLAGTCRVNIRWSHPITLSGDPIPVQGKWGRASGRGNQREVSGATKPYGESSNTASNLPRVVFCRPRQGEPKCPGIWRTSVFFILTIEARHELRDPKLSRN